MDKKEKVLDILSTIFEKEVDDKCSFQNEELWDSLNHLQIIVTLEEEFDVKFPQNRLAELTSVEKILEVLNDLC